MIGLERSGIYRLPAVLWSAEGSGGGTGFESPKIAEGVERLFDEGTDENRDVLIQTIVRAEKAAEYYKAYGESEDLAREVYDEVARYFAAAFERAKDPDILTLPPAIGAVEDIIESLHSVETAKQEVFRKINRLCWSRAINRYNAEIRRKRLEPEPEQRPIEDAMEDARIAERTRVMGRGIGEKMLEMVLFESHQCSYNGRERRLYKAVHEWFVGKMLGALTEDVEERILKDVASNEGVTTSAVFTRQRQMKSWCYEMLKPEGDLEQEYLSYLSNWLRNLDPRSTTGKKVAAFLSYEKLALNATADELMREQFRLADELGLASSDDLQKEKWTLRKKFLKSRPQTTHPCDREREGSECGDNKK